MHTPQGAPQHTPHSTLCTAELKTCDGRGDPLRYSDATERCGLSEHPAVTFEARRDDWLYVSEKRPHIISFSKREADSSPPNPGTLRVTDWGVLMYYYPKRNISFLVHPVGKRCYPTDKARVGVFIICFSKTVAEGFNLNHGFNYFSALSPKEVALARDISTYEELIYA